VTARLRVRCTLSAKHLPVYVRNYFDGNQTTALCIDAAGLLRDLTNSALEEITMYVYVENL